MSRRRLETTSESGHSDESDGTGPFSTKVCHRMIEKRKSLGSILEEAKHDQDVGAGSKLGLLDLLCIGIGSTIGSGVFVLTGKALPVAGPAAVISWLAAGLVCLLSSASYMELSARLPTKGSCYVFSYHGLGELASVVAAVCLTMEYGVSGAGVARTWSAKLSNLTGFRPIWCYNLGGWGEGCNEDDDYYADPIAAAITLLCTWIIAVGLNLGKLVINAFTAAKVALVAFMIVAGFSCWTGNMFESPSTLAPTGSSGVIKASSLLFFGFIGFDEVCCMASKAKNPSKTMPRALAGTLLGAALFSGLAQFALAAMVPYEPGMKAMPFEEAFAERGLKWARWLVSLGELILLPLVVLLSVLPQPEVTAAMSEDGLLPSIFRRRNKDGTYVQGTWIVGSACAFVALAVPFIVLWDIISLGVLFSFNLTNASLISLRYGNGGQVREPTVDALLFSLLVLTCIAGYSFHRGIIDPLCSGEAVGGRSAACFAISALGSVIVAAVIRFCFRTGCDMKDKSIFKAIGVPFVPALAMFFNFFLIATLPLKDWGYFSIFVAIFFVMYASYVSRNPKSVPRQDEEDAERRPVVLDDDFEDNGASDDSSSKDNNNDSDTGVE